MTDREKASKVLKKQLSSHWQLCSMIMVVLILSSFAVIQPISEEKQTNTPSPMASTATDDHGTPGIILTSTAEVEESPPTPEEIGYTNGIIFCSTVLVLILLVGTLRETIRREGR
jgi:hypothetical protein